MVQAAYSSGKPAYGVGAGNSTMVIDDTADIVEAARNTRISKTNDHGSGCSAEGNILVDASIYDGFLKQLQAEGGTTVAEDYTPLGNTDYSAVVSKMITASTICRRSSPRTASTRCWWRCRPRRARSCGVSCSTAATARPYVRHSPRRMTCASAALRVGPC